MIEKAVLYLLGAVTTGIGVLLMRWLRKDHVTEEIARRQSTAKLVANMRDLGVTEAQIDAARNWVEPKTALEKPALSAEDLLEEKEYAEIARAQTQAGMNEGQERRKLRLERRMAAALDDLGELLDEDSKRLLTESQEAWKTYHDRMVTLAGTPWTNGSMRPFIEAGASSGLLKARATELEDELAQMREEQQ